MCHNHTRRNIIIISAMEGRESWKIVYQWCDFWYLAVDTNSKWKYTSFPNAAPFCYISLITLLPSYLYISWKGDHIKRQKFLSRWNKREGFYIVIFARLVDFPMNYLLPYTIAYVKLKLLKCSKNIWKFM